MRNNLHFQGFNFCKVNPIRSFASASTKKNSLYTQLKPFIKFAKPEFRIVGYSIALLFISSSVTMSVPFSMGTIIDIVMEKDDTNGGPEEEGSNVAGYPLKNNTFIKEILTKTGSLPALFSVLGLVFIGLISLLEWTINIK